MACFTFTGMHADADQAIARATEQVSAFLKTHAWRNLDGETCYQTTIMLHKESNGYIFVITLIGPPEETA